MRIPGFLIASALVFTTAFPAPGQAAELPMAVEDFRLWRDYQAALGDARVQKMPEKQRLPAIARNFKVSEKVLRAAIASGEEHGEQMAKASQQNLGAALGDTAIGPRLKEVRVDASVSHVITYVTWTGEKPEAIDREVCLAATRVQKSSPLTSTIKLVVLDPFDPERKLFEGLISASNASRIKESSIVDFASTRYLKLFEKVERDG